MMLLISGSAGPVAGRLPWPGPPASGRVERGGDHGDQRRGLGDDEQPDQARSGTMEPPLASTGDDVTARVAGRTGHHIIGGGGTADVNQPLGGAG